MSLRTILSVFFVSSAVLALPAPRKISQRSMPIETIDDPSVLDSVDYAGIGRLDRRLTPIEPIEGGLELDPATSAVIYGSADVQKRQDVDFNDNTDIDHVIVSRPGFGPRKRQDVSIDGISSVPYFDDFVDYNPADPVDLASVTKRQDSKISPALETEVEPLIPGHDDISIKSDVLNARDEAKLHLGPGPVIVNPDEIHEDSLPTFTKRSDATPTLHLGHGPVVVNSDSPMPNYRVARPTPMKRDAPASATTAATTSVDGASTNSSDADGDSYSYDYGYDSSYGYDDEYDDGEYYVSVPLAEVVPQGADNSTATR